MLRLSSKGEGRSKLRSTGCSNGMGLEFRRFLFEYRLILRMSRFRSSADGCPSSFLLLLKQLSLLKLEYLLGLCKLRGLLLLLRGSSLSCKRLETGSNEVPHLLVLVLCSLLSLLMRKLTSGELCLKKLNVLILLLLSCKKLLLLILEGSMLCER